MKYSEDCGLNAAKMWKLLRVRLQSTADNTSNFVKHSAALLHENRNISVRIICKSNALLVCVHTFNSPNMDTRSETCCARLKASAVLPSNRRVSEPKRRGSLCVQTAACEPLINSCCLGLSLCSHASNKTLDPHRGMNLCGRICVRKTDCKQQTTSWSPGRSASSRTETPYRGHPGLRIPLPLL